MRLEHRISLAGELFRQARRSRREHAPAKDGRRRILVIRLDRIGDFALYLPFAAALRRAFPPESCHITLLGNTLWMPLARRMLDFDRFIELDPQRFLSDAVLRRTLLDEVAAMRCDLLLQPRFHRELLLEDLIAMAARRAGEPRLQRNDAAHPQTPPSAALEPAIRPAARRRPPA